MDDHRQMIDEVFRTKIKLLLIEGRAASGKTALMRKIAYDWAMGNLPQYYITIFIEFRDLDMQIKYETLDELIVDGFFRTFANCGTVDQANLENILSSMDNSNNILILLDGFDEVASMDICKELKMYLSLPAKSLKFHFIISSRPGFLSVYNGKEYPAKLNYAEILGFDTENQQSTYIKNHFSNSSEADELILAVKERLEENENFRKLAETPLFLTFICLVHEHLVQGSVFELYKCIIWWLIDRYQKYHPEINIPELFGYSQRHNELPAITVQTHFLSFPLVRNLGFLAFNMCRRNQIFSTEEFLKQHSITEAATKCGIMLMKHSRERLMVEQRFVFPHRTIQEFLAGGVVYFWHKYVPVIEKKQRCAFFQAAVNEDDEKNQCTHNKDFFNLFMETPDFSEVQNFIWRSVYSEKIVAGIQCFLNVLTNLQLDLAIMDQCYYLNNISAVLNACLRNCHRVESLRLAAYGRGGSKNRIQEIVEPFDFSKMQNLTLVYIGTDKPYAGGKTLLFTNSLLGIMKFSQKAIINCIEMDNCELYTESFQTTIDALANALHTTAIMHLSNVKIGFIPVRNLEHFCMTDAWCDALKLKHLETYYLSIRISKGQLEISEQQNRLYVEQLVIFLTLNIDILKLTKLTIITDCNHCQLIYDEYPVHNIHFQTNSHAITNSDGRPDQFQTAAAQDQRRRMSLTSRIAACFRRQRSRASVSMGLQSQRKKSSGMNRSLKTSVLVVRECVFRPLETFCVFLKYMKTAKPNTEIQFFDVIVESQHYSKAPIRKIKIGGRLKVADLNATNIDPEDGHVQENTLYSWFDFSVFSALFSFATMADIYLNQDAAYDASQFDPTDNLLNVVTSSPNLKKLSLFVPKSIEGQVTLADKAAALKSILKIVVFEPDCN